MVVEKETRGTIDCEDEYGGKDSIGSGIGRGRFFEYDGLFEGAF